MKTLLLMRHAKSNWDTPGLADHERELTPRGRAAAGRMAQFLAENRLVPHIILSSTAQRAKQTVEALLGGFAFAGDVFFYNELYQSSTEEILPLLCQLDNTASVVLLVGHNPEMEDFLLYLTDKRELMKTACVARVQFDIETWAQLAEDAVGKLVALWRPKELP